MRSAELVGLTPNGKFLIVTTDTGEELAIAADDRLRAALRGDRPRLGQREIEMESVLSPREIQTRIRAGEDVADVARTAGIGLDRVERFAAPVLAERDHIARQALSSSVRRRGETSANRILRNVVNERLLGRGVELSGVEWDSFRQTDGRWIVTATYASGGAERQAQFSFDPLGRFSVANNDEAHWILGDSSSSKGPQPGRRRPLPGEAGEDDTEPTLDLSDELALVRVVQDADHRAQAEDTIPVPPLRVVEGGWEPAIVVDYPVEPGPPEDASDEPTRHDRPTDLADRREEEDEFVEEHEAAEHDVHRAAQRESEHDVRRDVEPQPEAVPEPEPESASEFGSEPTSASEPGPGPAPDPAKPSRRKRASVPSWDEIMFGGRKD